MRKLCIVLLIVSLTLVLPAAVLADGQGSAGVLNKPIGAGSVNDLFIQMQNQLAEQTKITSSMKDQMDQITQKQQDANQASDYMKQAEELKDQAEKDQGKDSKIPDDLKDYMDQNDLNYDHTDGSLSSDQWDTAIDSLENHRDQVGTDIQKDMIDVQNMMGELNSAALPDLSSLGSGSKGMQTLSSTAKGQSLFSTSGTGDMKTVPIATSLVIGVALGMIAMWLIQRDKKRRSGAK